MLTKGGYFNRATQCVCPSSMREQAMKMIIESIGRWKEMMELEYQCSVDVEKVSTVQMKVSGNKME